jgi:hypothetical protein
MLERNRDISFLFDSFHVLKLSTLQTLWGRVILKNPPVAQLPKNVSTFYETRKFVTLRKRASHWSLP